MKNMSKSFATTVVATITLIYANAQTTIDAFSANEATGSPVSAIAKPTGEQKNNKALSDIHPRAIKEFQKSFKGITNEDWSKIADGYIATFSADSVKTMVAYNLKGVWHHTIQYYPEKKLSGNIRDIVKRTYYDYTILNIIEVSFGDQPVYMVYMQDETHLKAIRVYDGEMVEIQNYTRG
jgi:hypothetical protein